VNESELSALEDHRYVRMTTYRRDGRAVHIPMWFAFPEGARTGEVVYVVTGFESGKVKRIRAGSEIELIPSDWRGRPVREAGTVRVLARLLSDDESRSAEEALSKKYGLQYRVFDLVERRLVRGSHERVLLELTPGS
jgi:uncharacterized protein